MNNILLPEPKKRLDLIQALRGIAAILVVCYHTGSLYSKNLSWLVYNNTFKFGHTGVTFFFVLSGFIIYYIHYLDIGKPSQLPSFLYKRFTRIYPLYWIILVPKLLTKHIDIVAMFLAFFLIPVEKAYIKVSWTLSYELFFYVCFGSLIYCYNKYTKILISTLILFICLRIFLEFSGNGLNFNSFYLSFLFNAHIIEFMLGIFAAYIVINKKLLNFRNWLFVMGVILFAISSVFTVILVNKIAIQTNAIPFDQAEKISCFLENNIIVFFGIPFFLIVTGAAMIDQYQPLKVPKILLKLGDASYSIYLVHAIILNILTLKLQSINVKYLNYTVIPTIIIAILIGYIVHLIIEKPILNFFHKHSSRFTKKIN